MRRLASFPAVELGALTNLTSVVARATSVAPQPFEATLMRDDGAPVRRGILHGVTEGFFETPARPADGARGRSFTHDDHVPAGA